VQQGSKGRDSRQCQDTRPNSKIDNYHPVSDRQLHISETLSEARAAALGQCLRQKGLEVPLRRILLRRMSTGMVDSQSAELAGQENVLRRKTLLLSKWMLVSCNQYYTLA